MGYPRPDLDGGTPVLTWDQSLGYPPRNDMGAVEVLWDRDGEMEMGYTPPPPPGVNRLKT